MPRRSLLHADLRAAVGGLAVLTATTTASGARVGVEEPSVIAVPTPTGQCVGVLVAPNVALTAAHCVARGLPDAIVDGRGRTIQVRGGRAHGSYDDPPLQHDVGYLVLADDAGPAARLGPAPEPGRAAHFVGRGDPTRALTRGTARVRAVSELELELDPAPAAACNGDSGGPVFDDGGALVGVVSRGDRGCDGTTVATRLDANAELVQEALARGASDRGARTSPGAAAAFLIGVWSMVRRVRGTNERRPRQ